MLIVGLTGGIGSGKTTVSKLFSDLGIPIYYADLRARFLINEDSSLRASIQNIFGKDIYNQDGLDRKKMAEIVFANPLKLNELNKLVHPRVREDFNSWSQSQKSPYIIREAAILFESGASEDCDKIIFVKADEALRIKRVILRDDVSREDVLKRIRNQWPDAKKLELCDFIIDNNDGMNLENQVAVIHKTLLSVTEHRV